MSRAGAWAQRRGGAVAFADAVLRGIGQVFICNSPLSGLIFLIAIVVWSPFMCVCGLVGSLVATGVAMLFSFDAGAIASGVLAYNGVLASMAVGLFSFSGDHARWHTEAHIWAAVVFAGAISVVFSKAVGTVTVGTFHMAPYTFPFHLSTWVWLLASESARHAPSALASP
jgi:urea transporter